MKLLGERNWWAPAPLWRFYQRFGLREAPSAIAPSSDERDVDVSASAGDVNRDVVAETVGAGAGIMGR
jgi:RND superfamily putative drug exporter